MIKNINGKKAKCFLSIMSFFIFSILIPSNPALASIENVNPNTGEDFCNPLPAIKIPLFAAKKYAETGKIASSLKPRFPRSWYVVAFGKTALLKKLIKNNKELVKNKKLLQIAASVGNSDSLALLLANGADPNAIVFDRMSFLDVATDCQRAVNMTYLLNAGADPNKKNKVVGDAMSYTLLGIRREYFTLGVLVLLSSGYNVMCNSNRNHTAYFIYKTILSNYNKKKIEFSNVKASEVLEYQKLKHIVNALGNAMKFSQRRSNRRSSCQ